MNNMIDLILCKYYFIHNKEKKENEKKLVSEGMLLKSNKSIVVV